MRRNLMLAITFVCTLGVAMFAGTNIIGALQRTTYTATYSVQAGGLDRSYVVIGPVAALPAPAPVIVVLSGIAAPVSDEIKRDYLTPYVNAGKASSSTRSGTRSRGTPAAAAGRPRSSTSTTWRS